MRKLIPYNYLGALAMVSELARAYEACGEGSSFVSVWYHEA